jgi:hypothetical protein
MNKFFSNKLLLVMAVLALLFIISAAYYITNKRLNQSRNCPKYIDCMPGPGRSAACEIPKGCENITEVAY